MNDYAIVTGASSGLGYCLCEGLLKRGYNLIMIARDEEKLEKSKQALENENADASILVYAGDVSNEEFVESVFSLVTEQQMNIKYVFNCAGVGRFGPAENNTRENIDIALSASLIGLILMSSKAIGLFKENGGVIVNIMSTAALKGNPNESIYCAAKWGARGFTEAIKAATKGTATKVVAVYPGGMNTPFWNPECGQMPNVAKFMNPAEVAEETLSAVSDRKTMYVSELTIDRK